MPVKIYIDYLSQPSRAVLAFCKLHKLPVEVVETRINRLEQRSEQFTKINPKKTVPGMEDTDVGLRMGESHAIIRYLARKFKTEGTWYPLNDLKTMAKIDEYLDFHHLNTRRCAFYLFNKLFAKNLGIEDPTFNEEKSKKEFENALKFINKVYLSNSTYIVGEKPSVADLSAFFEIQFLLLLGYDFSKWENLSRWMKKMREIPQVMECNKSFYALLEKSRKNKEKPKL